MIDGIKGLFLTTDGNPGTGWIGQAFLHYRQSLNNQSNKGPGLLGHVFKTLEPRAFSSGSACVFA